MEVRVAMYNPGPSRKHISHILVNKYQTKFVKDIKVLPSKECIIQCESFLCNFMVKGANNTSRKVEHTRKIWKVL